MNIELYYTPDENIVVYKNLTNQISFPNSVAKGVIDVITPVIYLSTAVDVKTYNYCYISEFNRYYYITDVVAVRNGYWEIKLKVDVLMSYKDYLSSMQCIVKRSEQNNNTYLYDNENKTLAYKEIKTIKFPNSPLNKQMYYILTTVGGA